MATQTSVAKLSGEQKEVRVGESLTALALRRLRRDYLTIIAVLVLVVLTLCSVLAPVITRQLGINPTRVDVANAFQPVGVEGHPLGTDDLGRDHLARLLYAGQISLGIAFSAAFMSLGIGLSLGVITGYYGGIVDDLVNWVITTLNSIPSLFLLLIIAAVLRASNLQDTVTPLILVLGLLGWTGTTRLVRGETLSIREREYIVSAQAIGASPWRIMFVHIVPNLFSIIIITLALDIGALILTESGLSFLGLGVQPPTPTWGNMLTDAQTFFTRGAHLVVAPGLLIVITVLCLYIIGDGIRDAFDPTAKH